MKVYIKSSIVGSILSDGSFRALMIPEHSSRWIISSKSLDIINHPVWTGKRSKEETEISSFIDRFNKVY